jgi:riboflavin synthase
MFLGAVQIENTMFTGLIQNVGKLLSLTKRGFEAELKVSTELKDFVLGESIAVMGACLSVTNFGPGYFSAFASGETLTKTGMDKLRPGDHLNIERALKMGDPLGGHIVTGHVDDQIQLLSRTKNGEAERFAFELPAGPVGNQIASKGSVTLNGVSLTVNRVTGNSFDVMVIPLTLHHTTLGKLRPGNLVNIETDVLAKYVARLLERGDEKSEGINTALLAKAGFMR